MARAAYDHFSSILGTFKHRLSPIDLHRIGPFHFDLSALEQPFTEDEIWEATKRFPFGKALVLDGFTVEFLRSC